MWDSPLTAARVTAGALRLDQIQLDGEEVYWVEGRASEGGRNVIVLRTPDGRISDVTPPGFNVRTRVHEYGGAAYVAHQGVIYFSNFGDQRAYQQTIGGTPTALTTEGFLYADYRLDVARRRLVCVREDRTHSGQEAINTIVSLAIDGRGAEQVLVKGADFYSDPILSPSGNAMAWLEWRHPNMPWDGTELWRAAINGDGSIGVREKIAGGPSESIFQPEWAPDGRLYFVSDRSEWWNLYRAGGAGGADECVHSMPAEFGKPQWSLSMSTYAFVDANRIAATYVENGVWTLALITIEPRKCERVDLPVEPLESIRAGAGAVYFVGGSPWEAEAITRVDLVTREREVLRSSTSDRIAPEWVSIAEPVTFTLHDRDVHAFYYPPKNPEVEGPAREKPPLLVLTHGGPTAATTDVLDPEVLFWTSRGFAVLDVNYSGSTGYGRPYRDRLRGQWGVVDVEDAVGGAQAMVARGKADPARLMIRGGSAGGYTTLAALTFHDTFQAGASYYGISDIEVLAHDTQKFESRYMETLVGPYPATKDIYYERSPIHFTDRLSCPLILFQGLEDKVVPPNQSEMMAEALRQKGVRVEYVTFAGEQHGFRKAENIITALERELAFYRTTIVGV
jgi:dipeptidyl aminopeptidase/acylaminoacyl peptidase